METPAQALQEVAVARDLVGAARAIVATPNLDLKVTLAKATAKAWFGGRLAVGMLSTGTAMPERPGRPANPQLMMPRDMPRRSAGGEKGRFALLHALAHIELNAVDMTWDLVGRFAHEPMPRPFFDDWVQVGLCLLYTSPSPRDRQKSRMPSSA